MPRTDRLCSRPAGEPLALHPHPQPRLRRISAVLIALGLVGAALGVLGLIALGVLYGLPLLVLAAGFLIVLALPLVQVAVMHPQIAVYAEGLWLQPLLGRGAWVPWAAIVRLADHTLIRRGTTRRGQRAQEGQLVIVEGALPWPYQLVAGMAGLGWRTRAFGIAAHAQRDYPALLNAIQRHKGRG